MATIPISFDNRVDAYVTVNDALWARAKQLLGLSVHPTYSALREAVAVTKQLQAGMSCKKRTDAGHEVIVTAAGHNHRVDIKTLYPNYDAREWARHEPDNASSILADDLVWKVGTEVQKEARDDGGICLFDLSYLEPALRQTLANTIHEAHPSAITLEYDMDDRMLHVVWPAIPQSQPPQRFEYQWGG